MSIRFRSHNRLGRGMGSVRLDSQRLMNLELGSNLSRLHRWVQKHKPTEAQLDYPGPNGSGWGFLEPLNGSDETIGDEAAAEQHNSNNNHKIVLPIPANGGDDGGEKGKGRWCPKLTHTKTLAVKSGEGDVTVTNGGGGGEVRGI
ncbi:hypothetical protein V6N12_062147 [Hibiscus sabdariffa]|uniref:Uncharacterized protein n=1 Tax=Hibiscus sabdariffa TaxID=183260 RepID=A0ABR2F800_9ROSI